MLPPSTGEPRPRSAGLAVQGVPAVVRAVLHQLEPVGVVAPVLAGDVVAVLALLAGQGDLRTDIGGCHGSAPRLVWDRPRGAGVHRRAPVRVLRSCWWCGRAGDAVVRHADGPRRPGSVGSSGDRT